jgi:hypothetical protein
MKTERIYSKVEIGRIKLLTEIEDLLYLTTGEAINMIECKRLSRDILSLIEKRLNGDKAGISQAPVEGFTGQEKDNGFNSG